MLNVRQIGAFVAVMSTGSTTAAAEQLRTSQPGVSRLIRDLETALGLTLFARTGNRLAPTQEALILFREARRSYDGFQQVLQCAAEIRAGVVGRLRVVAMPALALGYLTRPLAALLKEVANLSVTVHAELSQNIPPLIAAGKFDIGIGSLPLTAEHVRLEPLPTLNAVCVMPADHPLAREEAVDLRALEHVPLLSPSGTSLLRTRLQMAMAASGVQPVFRVESSVSITLCAMVRQGLGIAIVDPFAAIDLPDQDLAVRPVAPAIPYESTLLLPNSGGSNTTVQRFVLELKKQMKTDFNR
jgi:DNA-binding transcriptional LysR family regulator